MSEVPCGNRCGRSAAVSVRSVLAAALCDVGTLWRIFLAFALWFAVSPVPWVNLGATFGLFGVAADVAHGRPVSPIDVLSRRNRARILPGLATLGFWLSGLAGAAALGALAAFQAGLLFAVTPGWTVLGAFLPCPCLAETPFQKFAALATCACGAVPALALASSWSMALLVFMDGGGSGLDALGKSARLVRGNLAPVAALALVAAIVALAAPLAVFRCGASVFSVFVCEAFASTLALSIFGRAYGALLAAGGGK